MAVFIALTTEAFESEFRRQGWDAFRFNRFSGRAGKRTVRRPTRGIEIKEDTYAIFKVIDASGKELELLDSSSPDGLSSKGYANFMLQAVQEARMEKHQIVETFGDSYIFFFGENPRFLDVQAVLLNTHDFNWRAEWWQNYHEHLRGTKLTEMGARLYMFYDDIVVEGYMLQAAAQESADDPYKISLSFRLFVTNYSNISYIEAPSNAIYPIRSSVELPEDIDLTSDTAALDIINTALTAQIEQQELSQYDTISEAVREAPATFGFPNAGEAFNNSATTTFGRAGIIDIDESVQGPLKLATEDVLFRTGNPLRGKIAENIDEYTGVNPVTVGSLIYDNPADRPPSAVKGTTRSIYEVEDLFRESIQFLSCYGADINNPKLLLKLGLRPNFKDTFPFVNTNPRVRVEDRTTYSPTGGQEETLINYGRRKYKEFSGSWDRFKKDPLDIVFGRPESEAETFGPARPKYTSGAGDPLYGYPSDFAERKPGFGISGFGDFGGKGFGSGQGESGDPGFKNPSKYTFAGVADNRSAFERFLKPREDNTGFSLNAGATLGTSGLSGGAVTQVNGKPSAFALVSVPGTLDETGNARKRAIDIAAKQESQRFGFSVDNPYGVNCNKPDIGFKLVLP